MRRVLGIDPGSVITGFGVIDTDGIRDFHVAHGVVRVVGETLPEKLGYILSEMTQIIHQWKPTEAGIEQVFVSNNPMSALKLGQARGAAICAAVQCGLPVAEYSARTVKQAAVGYGAAGKEQMQEMIRVLLSLDAQPATDAADGLAVALCHAHSVNTVGGSVTAASQRRGTGKRRARRWTSVP